MFHTYVTASVEDPVHGGKKRIDFDRASYLMDKELLQKALDILEVEKRNNGQTLLNSNADAAQFVWDDYVNRHFEKYGKSFIPNADPYWDT